ncbi:hypothetical protein BKA66DRAFT_177863 [Pyrenochaeta sp. MPI-SDFR-AT-0127]|nr:hypothetical protein BKA66DRAFT_177863 [Pyrenochaeta sp. MPI-SDFR-AT-0127]
MRAIHASKLPIRMLSDCRVEARVSQEQNSIHLQNTQHIAASPNHLSQYPTTGSLYRVHFHQSSHTPWRRFSTLQM